MTISGKFIAIYFAILALLLGGLVYSFTRRPAVEIKTETKIVTKIVYRDRHIADNIHKKKVTRINKDGSRVITETTSNTSKIEDKQTTSTKDVVQTTDTIIDKPNYIATVMYPVTVSTFTGSFDPSNIQLNVGKRIYSLPILIMVGTTPKFNNVSVGFTFEL